MVLVASGGAVGGIARALVALLLVQAAEAPHWAAPALLAVNLSGSLLAVTLSGSLLAGFLRGLLEREQASGQDGAELDAFMLVGFCGGFTSYSGFVDASVGGSAWICAATLVLCPFAALLGMRLSGGYPARSAGISR
jgi:fluoride ion exporter CrcB/FEX